MNLKTATKSDYNAIIQAFSLIYESVENKAHFNWPEMNVRSELDKSKVLFFEDSSQQVASFICYREGFDHVEVMALGTIPQYKQQGLMRKLLNHLQDYSRKASKDVILEVSSGNRNAINLYEANEFFKVGVRRAYYGDGSDALVYSYKADLKV